MAVRDRDRAAVRRYRQQRRIVAVLRVAAVVRQRLDHRVRDLLAALVHRQPGPGHHRAVRCRHRRALARDDTRHAVHRLVQLHRRRARTRPVLIVVVRPGLRHRDLRHGRRVRIRDREARRHAAAHGIGIGPGAIGARDDRVGQLLHRVGDRRAGARVLGQARPGVAQVGSLPGVVCTGGSQRVPLVRQLRTVGQELHRHARRTDAVLVLAVVPGLRHAHADRLVVGPRQRQDADLVRVIELRVHRAAVRLPLFLRGVVADRHDRAVQDVGAGDGVLLQIVSLVLVQAVEGGDAVAPRRRGVGSRERSRHVRVNEYRGGRVAGRITVKHELRAADRAPRHVRLRDVQPDRHHILVGEVARTRIGRFDRPGVGIDA